jgi:hypothetical protein
VSTFRPVAAARGAAWLLDGLRGLRRAPGAYLGACLMVALLGSIPGVGLLLGPVFYGGLLALLRTRASGGEGHPGQAFAGFTAPGAFGRLLPIAAFNVVFVVLVLAVAGGAAQPEIEAIAGARAAGTQPTEAQMAALLTKMGPALLALLPLAAFVSWVLMLAIPRAMLDGVGGITALRQAAGAVWVNLPAFALNFLCLMAAFAVLFTGLVLARALLAGLLPGTFAQMALMAAFTTAGLAVYCAQMHEAASDVFAAVAPSATPTPPDVFEA